MVPTPDFTGYTQHFSEETLTTYWSSVSALTAHLFYHKNFGPIYVAFRRFLGYFSLRGPHTTPTSLYTLPGNSDANFPYSDPLRRNSRSGSRHVSPVPTCPRLLARRGPKYNRILRQQREEPHPLLPINSTILSFWFLRSAQRNGTKAMGGISWKALAPRGSLLCFPSSHRCVYSGCVFD